MRRGEILARSARRTDPPAARWFALFVSMGMILGGAIALLPGHPSPTLLRGAPATAPTISGTPSTVAIPPVRGHTLGLLPPDTVNPTALYGSEPAPMGIGDFGVGHNGAAYTYNTSEFLSNFSWNSLKMNGPGGTAITNQLNVVLKFVQGGNTYAYWIQDVAILDSSDGSLYFEDNIWNFSSSSLCLTNTDVSGNGSVTPLSGCEGYYAVASSTQPGAFRTMPSPGNFQLLVRSYRSGAGTPEVAFEYRDGVTTWYVTYDNVVWPWATAVTADDNFVVDGTQYNPAGIFYDAELTLGGPGNGYNTTDENPTHASSQLFFWNGHNFQAPISAWNFGSDTAEDIGNIQSIGASASGGTPLTLQLNGTLKDASPGRAYDQSQVGFLHITAPGFTGGVVELQGVNWSFAGNQSTFTLEPGYYGVWVNSTGSHDDLGTCLVSAGATLNANTTDGCLLVPTVSHPRASPAAVDVGQSVAFSSTLLTPGYGGDTYSWSTSPSGLGCSSSTALQLTCTPTAVGTYHVNVTVTDSHGQEGYSGNLTFVVSSDPSVTAPMPSRAQLEVGGSVDFTTSASGGVAPYSYTWSGLPSGCTGTTGAAPHCVPTSAGSFTISVRVTDANQLSVTSSSLAYTVASGPSVSVPSASPAAGIDANQSVNFSVQASGGLGPYTYRWLGLPAGCVSTNASILTCRPTAGGTSRITAEVTDGVGGNGTSAALSYTVHTDPSVRSRASSDLVDVAESTTFTASASEGSGGYAYRWSGLPVGCSDSATAELTCAPQSAGNYNVTVTVNDTDGWKATAVIDYRVLLDPSVTSFSASPSTSAPGSAVTLRIVVQYGLAPYRFNYSGLPPGCVGSNSSTLVCDSSVTGTFTVTATVTDANGMQVIITTTFTVQSELFGLPTSEAYDLIVGIAVAGAAVAVLAGLLVRRKRARARNGP